MPATVHPPLPQNISLAEHTPPQPPKPPLSSKLDNKQPSESPQPPPKAPVPPPSSPKQSPRRTHSPTLSRTTPEPKATLEEDDDVPSAEPPIDMDTFNQILDLDEDDDDHEFSKEMAWAYFSQAEKTFKEMEIALAEDNLVELSGLGHFLKGSSAALGVSKVQASCEKIQHYGLLQDDDAGKVISEAEALARIKTTLVKVQKEYCAAEKWLREWYEDRSENT